MTQAPSADLNGPFSDPPPEHDVEVGEAAFSEVSATGPTGAGAPIEVLLDTAVQVTATLGSVRVPVRDLLEHGPGSVLRLDRAAGDPVDLHLNGIRFATGHLVVVGDRLGIRIREVLPPEAAPGDLPQGEGSPRQVAAETAD